MTREEAKAILESIKYQDSSPEYEDLIQWVEDACKTIANEAPLDRSDVYEYAYNFDYWMPLPKLPEGK